MSISLPLYLSAVSDSQKKTCRANMHTIANAVQANKARTMGLSYATYMGALDLSKIPDIQVMPLCTQGGSYSIDKGSSDDDTTFKVVCSVSAHGSFEAGVDSN
jgi:type IV pilus assembly protein PilA